MPHAIRWTEITAYLGGTFDPPHLGHLEAARGLLEAPQVKAVQLVPSGQSVQKQPQASAAHRLALLRLLIEDQPDSRDPQAPIQIEPIEIQSPDPSYTWGTLQRLPVPPHLRAWVIGTDQLQNLPSWHRFPEILGQCHWIVLGRKGFSQELPPWVHLHLKSCGRSPWGPQFEIPGRSQSPSPLVLQWVETPSPEISSRALRAAWAKGSTELNHQIPSQILDYLKEHHLYGN